MRGLIKQHVDMAVICEPTSPKVARKILTERKRLKEVKEQS